MTCDQYKTRLRVPDNFAGKLYNIVKDQIILDLNNNCLRERYDIIDLYPLVDDCSDLIATRVAVRLVKELSDKGFDVTLIDDEFDCIICILVPKW